MYTYIYPLKNNVPCTNIVDIDKNLDKIMSYVLLCVEAYLKLGSVTHTGFSRKIMFFCLHYTVQTARDVYS